MDFEGHVSSVSVFGAGGYGVGASFLMEAYSGGNLVASSSAAVGSGNQWIEIRLDAISPAADRVTITETTGKTAWVFDDLTFSDPAGLEAFCFGDGSGHGCPCGNISTAEEGCQNSSGVGALALANGPFSMAADQLTVDASGLIPGQAALLFSGTLEHNGGAGNIFGDGLLCVSGPITRLGVKIPDASGQATWGPGLVSSLVGAQVGDFRTLQVWYRDTAGMPCGSGFNLSNGLRGTILP